MLYGKYIIKLSKDTRKVPHGLIVGQHRIPIDPEIIRQMAQYGISADYAEKCIEGNKHNHVTTTYYLILKKFIIAGNKSIAGTLYNNIDIGSELFEP